METESFADACCTDPEPVPPPFAQTSVLTGMGERGLQRGVSGLGHFPMQENPIAFARHLLPVLERIKASE